MLRALAVTTRALVVFVSAVVGAHLPSSPGPVLLVVLVGAAVLVPLVARFAGALARSLSSVPHGPPGISRAFDAAGVPAPAAPGTPGTALARAPSRRVRAFA